MLSDKFYRMLGLATRAGSVVFGQGAAKDSIRSKKALLVLVAKDASDNTKKKFYNSTEFYSVPYFEAGDKLTLGKATGREFLAVLSITDKSFAESLIKILTEN